MSKRKTKAQREADHYREVRDQVAAIYAGARGLAFESDDEDWLQLAEASRALPALQDVFDIPEGSCVLAIGNIDKFETIESATEWLIECEELLRLQRQARDDNE